jgi:hypothetical protein
MVSPGTLLRLACFAVLMLCAPLALAKPSFAADTSGACGTKVTAGRAMFPTCCPHVGDVCPAFSFCTATTQYNSFCWTGTEPCPKF